MRHIGKIILHSSATPEGRDVSVETIRQWHKQRGFDDIGYHFIVDLDGGIHNGRHVEVIGAHARGHNRDSIGVCYVGGANKDLKPLDTRTAAQKKSLEIIICNLLDEYKDAKLYGHNEFSSKACPSFNVQEEYKEIIKHYERKED